MSRFLRVSSIAIVTGALVATGCLVGLSSSAAAPSHPQKGAHHHHGRRESAIISASVAPSVPTDPMIFGVVAGGAAWTIDHGHARLGNRGALEVDVRGLVLTMTKANPVPDLAASVFCDGAAVATTAPVAFSSGGDAHIHACVTLPGFCAAPAILLNPATSGSTSGVLTAVYIAFDGTASS